VTQDDLAGTPRFPPLPFSDDTSTSRDMAFAKIRSRVLGNALAAEITGAR
jgi:hypothetical protein